MRKLILPFLLLILISTLAIAQDEQLPPNIPTDQIAAAAEPFLGNFDAITCEPDGGVGGLSFEITQKTPTENPIVTLKAVYTFQSGLQVVTNEFNTVLFYTQDDYNVLVFENGSLVVRITTYKDKLIGYSYREEGAAVRKGRIVFARNNDGLEVFTKSHANICSDLEELKKFVGMEENDGKKQ